MRPSPLQGMLGTWTPSQNPLQDPKVDPPILAGIIWYGITDNIVWYGIRYCGMDPPLLDSSTLMV